MQKPCSTSVCGTVGGYECTFYEMELSCFLAENKSISTFYIYYDCVRTTRKEEKKVCFPFDSIWCYLSSGEMRSFSSTSTQSIKINLDWCRRRHLIDFPSLVRDTCAVAILTVLVLHPDWHICYPRMQSIGYSLQHSNSVREVRAEQSRGERDFAIMFTSWRNK